MLLRKRGGLPAVRPPGLNRTELSRILLYTRDMMLPLPLCSESRGPDAREEVLKCVMVVLPLFCVPPPLLLSRGT